MSRIVLIGAGEGSVFADGPAYLGIAQSLASGHGFTQPNGPWPGQPNIMRVPLWPFLLSLPLRVFAGCNPTAVARFTAAFLHAITAFAVALLAWSLTGSTRRMLLAGCLTALLPNVQPYLMAGLSESCTSAVLALGTLLLCLGKRCFFPGVIVLSLLPLVRANFLAFPAWIVIILLILRFLHWDISFPITKRRLITAAVLFYIPITAWVLRNYRVTGVFPITAGDEGATFYGNYNSISGSLGPSLGLWVPPHYLPDASQTSGMSQGQIVRYYRQKGLRFMIAHWRMVPLIMGAHLVRAFLPKPFSGPHKYAYWVFRTLLYGAAILAIRQKSLPLSSLYAIFLLATALTVMTTVILYLGEDRMLYPLLILLLPLVCSLRLSGRSPKYGHQSELVGLNASGGRP